MRQQANPVIINNDGVPIRVLDPSSMDTDGHGQRELVIQDIVHQHPDCLPIEEIDPLFSNPVSLCKEMTTPSGSIDNVLVTPNGLPILVECKLWRNPEARRKVIGQILDYSKELTRWTSSDFQREVGRRLNRKGNVLIELLGEAGHRVDEIAFNDALSFNLRRGRFLLLIVGDGIRQGVEAIAEYLQEQSGLHFTLGLVELPIFNLSPREQLIVPRVIARTQNIVREVIALPDGFTVRENSSTDSASDGRDETPEQQAARTRLNAVRQKFWRDFLDGLDLDDDTQLVPDPSLGGHVVFKFGAPGGSSWLTVFRDNRQNRVGLFLSGNRNSPGERAMQMLEEQSQDILAELGGNASVNFDADRPDISDEFIVESLELEPNRTESIEWLQKRTNDFVNTLRPRIRSALKALDDS